MIDGQGRSRLETAISLLTLDAAYALGQDDIPSSRRVPDKSALI